MTAAFETIVGAAPRSQPEDFFRMLRDRLPSTIRAELIADFGWDLQHSVLTIDDFMLSVRRGTLPKVRRREWHWVLTETASGYIMRPCSHDPYKLLYVAGMILYCDCVDHRIPPTEYRVISALILNALRRADETAKWGTLIYLLCLGARLSKPEVRMYDPRPWYGVLIAGILAELFVLAVECAACIDKRSDLSMVDCFGTVTDHSQWQGIVDAMLGECGSVAVAGEEVRRLLGLAAEGKS